LAQQGDGGGDGLRGAGQAQGPAGQGSGGAGRVQQQCGGGAADLAGVRGVGGVVVRSGAGSLAEAEPSGECGGPLGHAVGGGVLEGGHHQPGQSRVPVGGQHVGVVEEFGGHLAGEGGGVVPGALQGEVEAASCAPVQSAGQGVAGDVADAAGGGVGGRQALGGGAGGARGGPGHGPGEGGDVDSCEHLRWSRFLGSAVVPAGAVGRVAVRLPGGVRGVVVGVVVRGRL